MLKLTRHSLRGFQDLLERLFRNIGLSLGWWLCAFTFVFLPVATLAICWVTQPVRNPGEEPPSLAEIADFSRDRFRRSWKVALATWPLLLLLGFSFIFYSGGSDTTILLAPITLIAFTATLGWAVHATSLCVNDDLTVSDCLKQGLTTLINHPLDLLAFGVIALVVISLSSLLILPLFVVTPALLALLGNRFTNAAMGQAFADPNLPTAERLLEKQAAGNGGWRERFRPQ